MSPNGSTITSANGQRRRALSAAPSCAATSHTFSPFPPACTACAKSAISCSAGLRSPSHSSGSLGNPIHTASCGAHSGSGGWGGGVMRASLTVRAEPVEALSFPFKKNKTAVRRAQGERNWFGSARVELDHEVRLHPHRIGHFVELGHARVGDLGGAVGNHIVGDVALGEALRLDD